MTDHANEIRDVLMWAQAYAPDRLAHRLIDAEESLRELLAGHAAEVEQLRDGLVCSWCGEDYESDGAASDCCSCDPIPRSSLLNELREARKEQTETMEEWEASDKQIERERDEARADAERLRNRLRDAPLGGDGSHWDGCHLVHIDCARAYIEDLAAERDAAVADRDRLAKALDLIGHGWDGDEFNDPADLTERYASIALAALAGREGSDRG